MFFFVFFENLNLYLKNEENMPFVDETNDEADKKSNVVFNEINADDTFLNKIPERIVNLLNNFIFSNLNIYSAFIGSFLIYSIYIG
jgi:hypothetical protein